MAEKLRPPALGVSDGETAAVAVLSRLSITLGGKPRSNSRESELATM